MNRPALQVPAATRDDILKAVDESLASPAEPQTSVAARTGDDPVALADAILARLPVDRGHSLDDRAARLFALPLNLRGVGTVAYLAHRDIGVQCVAVFAVARGRFVFGSDNNIFGQWDALVAARSTPGCTIFPAHGGEIIPGTLEDHISRIRQNLADGKRLPVQLDMDVSMACPSSCVFCFSAAYRASRTTGRMMQTRLMLRLIRQWGELGVKVVRFDGGGDPLTHPGLLGAIDLCHDLGLRTAVLTAGDLLGRHHVDTFVRARTYVRVSLNAAGDETRRALHGHRDGRYGVHRIFEAVSSLAGSRDDVLGSAGRTQMPIGATSMVHPVNVRETVSIAKHAKRAGFDHLSFRVILGKDHRVSFTPSARAELAAAFDEIRRTVAGPGFQVFMPTRDVTDQGYVPSQYFTTCRASTHRALVEVGTAPDCAAIVPCGRYRGHGYRADTDPGRVVFGYLDDSVGIDSVWMQPSMERLLASFPDACGDCIDRSANTFLEAVETILRGDPGAGFFPFAVANHAGGDLYA